MNIVTVESLKKIDSTNAPAFQKLLTDAIDQGAEKLVVDFANTSYISSAGLRALLTAQKLMKKNGREMTIKNVCPIVMEVFDITGFSGFLNFEE